MPSTCRPSNLVSRLLLLLCTFLCCARPVYASDKGLELNQTHFFLGNTKLTVAPGGVRMENLGRLRFKLVAKPPNWDVTVFRDDDKTFFTQSLAKFETDGMLSDFVSPRDQRTFGYKARQSSFQFLGKKVIRLTSFDKTLKFLPLNGLPSKVEGIIYGAYKLPTNGGITIGYSTTHYGRDYFSDPMQRGSIQQKLTTQSIKDVLTTGNMFVVPRGYKATKSVREVISASSTRKKDPDFKMLFYKD